MVSLSHCLSRSSSAPEDTIVKLFIFSRNAQIYCPRPLRSSQFLSLDLRTSSTTWSLSRTRENWKESRINNLPTLVWSLSCVRPLSDYINMISRLRSLWSWSFQLTQRAKSCDFINNEKVSFSPFFGSFWPFCVKMKWLFVWTATRLNHGTEIV